MTERRVRSIFVIKSNQKKLVFRKETLFRNGRELSQEAYAIVGSIEITRGRYGLAMSILTLKTINGRDSRTKI